MTSSTTELLVPVSIGELIDKITILEIKAARIPDPQKLANVQRELQLLDGIRSEKIASSAELDGLTAQLKDVNTQLWDIEDRIRDFERNKSFGQDFVDLARSVYRSNDLRAALKRQINELFGSLIVEEKSYSDY